LISGYLNQSVKRFDLFMENLHRASMSIAFNKDLNKILARINQGSYEDYNNLLRINDLISTFNNTNRFVYLVNIYDFKNGVIIPSRGTKRKINLEDSEYKLVKSLLIDNSDAYKILYHWVESRIINLNGVEKNVLTFAIPIKDNFTGEIIGSVMTYVPEEHISGMCLEISFSSGGNAILVNSSGKAISSSEPNLVGENFFDYLNVERQGNDSYIRKIDGKEYLVSYRKSNYIDWSFLSIVPIKIIMQKNTGVLRNTFVFIGLGTILLAFLLSYIVNFYFYKPIRYLIDDIKAHIKEKNLDLKPISRDDEIGFIFNSFYEILLENRVLIENIYEQKILLQEAEIRLLYSQINPHFLYNSLDSIIWMLMFKQYDDIGILVKALVKFFRITLSEGNEIITVRQAKERIESYFIIQKIRYSDRLIVDVDFEESILEFKMLKLMLQPVVENSIYHGVEKKLGEGIIKVTGRQEGDVLVFKVEDNGVGISPQRLDEVNKIINSEEQQLDQFYALQNINKRIKIFYGDNYGISLESSEGEGTIVNIKVHVIEVPVSE